MGLCWLVLLLVCALFCACVECDECDEHVEMKVNDLVFTEKEMNEEKRRIKPPLLWDHNEKFQYSTTGIDEGVATLFVEPLGGSDITLYGHLTVIMVDADESVDSICERLNRNASWMKEIISYDINMSYDENIDEKSMNDLKQELENKCTKDIPVLIITKQYLSNLTFEKACVELQTGLLFLRTGGSYIVVLEKDMFDNINEFMRDTFIRFINTFKNNILNGDYIHYFNETNIITNSTHNNKTDNYLNMKLSEQTDLNEQQPEQECGTVTNMGTSKRESLKRSEIILISVTFSIVGAFTLAVIISALSIKYCKKCKNLAKKHLVNNPEDEMAPEKNENTTTKDINKVNNLDNNTNEINNIKKKIKPKKHKDKVLESTIINPTVVPEEEKQANPLFIASDSPAAMSGMAESRADSVSVTEPMMHAGPSTSGAPLSQLSSIPNSSITSTQNTRTISEDTTTETGNTNNEIN